MNGESFEEINHQDAVSFLGSLRSRNQANQISKIYIFMVSEPQPLSHRGQIILELKSSEAVSEDDPSNLDYRWRSTKVEKIRIFF